MANNREAIQAMEERMAMIRLEDEEEGGLIYEENAEELSDIDVRWCLVGRSDHNPNKSGDAVGNRIIQNRMPISEVNGLIDMNGDTFVHNTTGGISKNIQTRETLDLNETNGLEVLDPKRRRVEEPITSGLNTIQTNDDTDMDET
ncbi:hypothetical protein POM88_026964 [Heracleum sosnowskyi]|uniref:Uncharacterized protein n=1 Tax=Heracleum sosnowskyi TaxID=360622 RepID=A0AAD8ML29_9APIA|nr:hypothetical protein POM88_026964 [Heracleum sosnowskyi]